jgi:5-(hydroxymethyl)furfural/furfural oxidase
MGELTNFDALIVGGGSSGCVLASRLSEDAGRRVLLLEAGEDTPAHAIPEVIASGDPEFSYFDPRYHWPQLRVHYRSIDECAVKAGRLLEQAMVLGGGSSINGQIAFRGLPSDYDEWAELGLRTWSFDKVEPYFIKLERDLDFNGPHHGTCGPIPIRRLPAECWPPFSRACLDVMRREGRSFIEDGVGDYRDGAMPMPMSNENDKRVSSAIGYLTTQVRARPNLEIRCKAFAERVIFDGHQAVGVVARYNEVRQTILARETIISAGALQSPALLMRSGIGPGSHLREMSIDVVADLPGVGQNLQDHPETALVGHLKPGARIRPGLKRAWFVGLRYSSGYPNCARGDMFALPIDKTAWHRLGRSLCSIIMAVHKSYSRGLVRLRHPSPDSYPLIAFNMLSDERDLVRLTHAMRYAYWMIQQPEITAQTNHWFLGRNDDAVRAIGQPTRENRIKTGLIAEILDCGPARKLLAPRILGSDRRLAAVFANESTLRDWVKESAWSSWHPVGTCKMGQQSDPLSVLDEQCQVRKVDGLRVVDCSIMPTIVTANTNIPAIMIAEKLADVIRGRAECLVR